MSSLFSEAPSFSPQGPARALATGVTPRGLPFRTAGASEADLSLRGFTLVARALHPRRSSDPFRSASRYPRRR